MARIKYYYDTETCRYEKMKTNYWEVLVNVLVFIVLSFICAFVMLKSYAYFFDTQKEATVRKENEELKLSLEQVSQQVTTMNSNLMELRKKDNEVYRLIFEAEPIKSKSDSVDMKQLDVKSMKTSEDLIEKIKIQIETLSNQLKIQKTSFEAIEVMAANKQKMLYCIPAIRPLKNHDINSLVSGFGWRIHPIYKVPKMHTGLDFSAKTGTPIYSTGDGVVVVASNVTSEGYGNQVEINHGYGLRTKYAHMSKIKTRVGKTVKRGELIGYVGSTGTSVAPHLHYEVIKNGQKVDPINYFYNDVTPAEYQKMIEISSQENQSLGGE